MLVGIMDDTPRELVQSDRFFFLFSHYVLTSLDFCLEAISQPSNGCSVCCSTDEVVSLVGQKYHEAEGRLNFSWKVPMSAFSPSPDTKV